MIDAACDIHIDVGKRLIGGARYSTEPGASCTACRADRALRGSATDPHRSWIHPSYRRFFARGVSLAFGKGRYVPANSMGKMFFNILATFAEFESGLTRIRRREGVDRARQEQASRKQPKLAENGLSHASSDRRYVNKSRQESQ
jgi:hypothetical protein